MSPGIFDQENFSGGRGRLPFRRWRRDKKVELRTDARVRRGSHYLKSKCHGQRRGLMPIPGKYKEWFMYIYNRVNPLSPSHYKNDQLEIQVVCPRNKRTW